MHFKDEKEAAQQKMALFFQVLFAESKNPRRAITSLHTCNMTSLDSNKPPGLKL